MPARQHVPVLREEVVGFLARPEAVFIDGTVGDGGHAAALLTKSGRDSRLLGIDLDPEAVVRAREVLGKKFGRRVKIVHDTFAHLRAIAKENGFEAPTGILFDLGMSTRHLEAERGFSFHNLGLLNMRFDSSCSVELPSPEHPALRRLARRLPFYRAVDILSLLKEEELADLLSMYGGERYAKRIAEAVVRAREHAPIVFVPELVQLIISALPPRARHGRIHAATRTFQALRIAVNREYETLRRGIEEALSLLAPGGRLAIISFHSGEDRIVKEAFRVQAAGRKFTLLTKRPLCPSLAERQANPRSRSAHLRVIERREKI